MIERKPPKANLDIGAVREFADGPDTHANSDVPSIAPQSNGSVGASVWSELRGRVAQ
jgi:hypothetical protein